MAMKVLMGGIPPASRTDKNWISGMVHLGDIYQDFNLEDVTKLKEVDCFFQFNINNPIRDFKPHKRAAYEYILHSKKPFLVLEEGGFRQYCEYKRYGWLSYQNGIGIFNNENVDDSRWKKFLSSTGLKIKDWNSPGDTIVVMGQVHIDSAVVSLYERGYPHFYAWVEETIGTIRKHTDRNIFIRPHPGDHMFDWLKENVNRLNQQYKNISVSDSKIRSIYDDLKNAHCVVTYNSNSSVEALCEGIPIFSLDKGSTTYEISHTDLSQIENLNYNIDISKWCHKVAYTMWTDSEVANGETWAHLKPVYFK